MMCLHCTKLDFKGNETREHKEMLSHGFGPCTGLPGPSVTEGGHMTKWMAMDTERQCPEFDQVDEEAVAARMDYRQKLKRFAEGK
jgi:hypothetical protein